jgi:HAD superfamily hydrolase (TIGR01509 family)
MLRALIWDVDGTIAETERDGHRIAFNRAFEALGLPWRWDVAAYGNLLEVAGGRERLLHFMAGRADAPPGAAERAALAAELHRRKNACYADIVAQGGIAARPGVLRLMDACRGEQVQLAIATTTSSANVQALMASLLGAPWRCRFAAVVCGENAPLKKPHPQVYELALRLMEVAPDEAVAIEDSPNGLQSALAAGVRCGVTRSAYFRDAAFEGASWVRDDLESPPAMTLQRLRDTLSATIADPSVNPCSQP